MEKSPQWLRSRATALILVLLLHGLFLFLGTRMPAVREWAARTPPTQADSLQIVLLPPVQYPRLKLQIAIARPFGGNPAITVEQPRLDGVAVAAQPGPASNVPGSRDGVDWAAEARRELRAMEIRRNRNPGINTVSMRLGEEYWMLHARHFPGDRLKTENGDWVIWLSDDCYQIATAAPNAAPTDALAHQSICRERSPERAPDTTASDAAPGRP